MRLTERIATALDGILCGEEWSCQCPAHDDQHRSFSIRDGNRPGDRLPVLFKCHAGCEPKAIIAKLQERNLWPEGCTLETYALAKNLSVEFLRQLGMEDVDYKGKPAISIPYLDAEGKPIAIRYRLSLTGKRFMWERGAKQCLYGLNRLATTPKTFIFLVEGESDCHALWSADLPAIGLPGNKAWNEGRDAPHLDGFETIYVIIEPGPSGRGMLSWIGQSSIRERVRLLDFGALEDPSALYVTNPEWWEVLTRMIEKSESWAEFSVRQPQKARIEIVRGELDRMATEAEAALLASGLPVYQRGRVLVQPIDTEVPSSDDGMTTVTGFNRLTAHGLRDLLSQAADWISYDARTQTHRPADPPDRVVETVLARVGHWKLPVVAGVIAAPTLRRDGTILVKPGYDGATRLYYRPDPALEMPPVSPTPTRAEAEAALALLSELLDEFPFVARVDRAVALSGVMVPVLRGMLPLAPLHAYTATEAGSGKSLLADIISLISTGRLCPVAPAGRTEEEAEKRLTGMLLPGYSIISLDNMTQPLGGDLLCQALDHLTVRVRALGRSDMEEIENRATIMANGNNLRVRGDMTRRTLLCRLDAQVERPELRQFKRDPVRTILPKRGRYIAAVLTIVVAYRAAGQPNKLRPIGSYEAWSDSVRSALVWLGEADPAASMEITRKDDPERESLRAVFTLWAREFGTTEPITVQAMIQLANERSEDRADPAGKIAYTNPEWRDALLLVAGETGDRLNNQKLGQWLHANEGRILDDMRIERAEKRTRRGLVLWTLREMVQDPEGKAVGREAGIGRDFSIPSSENVGKGGTGCIFHSAVGMVPADPCIPADSASPPRSDQTNGEGITQQAIKPFRYQRRTDAQWQARIDQQIDQQDEA